MIHSLARNTCRSCRFIAGLFFLMFVFSSSGCSIYQSAQNYVTYNDTVNDFVMGWRNGVWARQAWHERKGQFVGENQFYDFGEGFRAGYEDVASGGNGCPPGLAPRKYWTWKYQSPEGQAKVAAWFAGYPHGARAAEEDGAGLYQQIQISTPLERQYAPEFVTGTTIPGEEIPPGQLQAPRELPAVPTPEDSSHHGPSPTFSRGLSAYQSTSTLGTRVQQPNVGYVSPPSLWPAVTQASATTPVPLGNSALPTQGVQQPWTMAR